MNKLQASIFVAMLSLLLVTPSQQAAISEAASGKKKRDSQYASISDEDRYNLLRALIQRAALENTAS